MNIIQLKWYLKRYKNLWQYLKIFKHLVKKTLYPIYWVFSPLVINRFMIKHEIDKSTYILFAYGSMGDTFYMASLMDAFADKYGQTLVIASKNHTNVFRIFSTHIKLNYLWLDEPECIKLRRALSFTRYYEKKGLIPGVIRPLHIVLHRDFYKLILTKKLYYREAITQIMGLNNDIPYNYVSYSDSDRKNAATIFDSIGKDIGSIALINPICYTHRNITADSWQGIADALIANGYNPVFNVKQNPDDKNQHSLVPAGFPVVEIPAYLVPACADIVGIGCARHGGGFDLLQSFSVKENRTILIALSSKLKLSEFEKPDPSYEDTERVYRDFSGKFFVDIVLLNADDRQESYTKTINTLQYHNKLQE